MPFAGCGGRGRCGGAALAAAWRSRAEATACRQTSSFQGARWGEKPRIRSVGTTGAGAGAGCPRDGAGSRAAAPRTRRRSRTARAGGLTRVLSKLLLFLFPFVPRLRAVDHRVARDLKAARLPEAQAADIARHYRGVNLPRALRPEKLDHRFGQASAEALAAGLGGDEELGDHPLGAPVDHAALQSGDGESDLAALIHPPPPRCAAACPGL